MKIRVRRDRLDWRATCTCGQALTTDRWADAMAWACGHLTFWHQRQHRPQGETP